MHCILLIFALLTARLYGLTVQSIQHVACSNKAICQDGMNLRIVIEASATESSTGSGSITGVIEDQQWTDEYGTWELGQSINIDVSYNQAAWVYTLDNSGTFKTQSEEVCGEQVTACSSYEHSVSCPDRNGYGLGLREDAECYKFGIQTSEQWKSLVTIKSRYLDMSWNANQAQTFQSESNAEVSVSAVFDKSSCYQDLTNNYYVVVPTNTNQYHYFIAQSYWQNSRNNFNMSASAWKNNFDCGFDWEGWHTIIPFYRTDDEYKQLCGGSNCRNAMSSNQLYAFANGYIPAYFYDIMTIPSGDCVDNTTFTDPNLESIGPSKDNKYVVSKQGIVDHFEITMDLDYTDFIKVPTQLPTSNPSLSPTTSSPTQKPTFYPSKTPSRSPTPKPSYSPIKDIGQQDALFETPAILEMTVTESIDFASTSYATAIAAAIASSVGTGREYIRLDGYQEVNGRRRRLNDATIFIEFTILTKTEADQAFFRTKLRDTSVFTSISTAIQNEIPAVTGVLVTMVVTEQCEEGTKAHTVANERRCISDCGANQYYDQNTGECAEQERFIVTTVIQKDNTKRFLNFLLGVFLYGVTVGAVWGLGKYKKMRDEQEAQQKREKKLRKQRKKRERATRGDENQPINSKYQPAVETDSDSSDDSSESESDSDSDDDSDSSDSDSSSD